MYRLILYMSLTEKTSDLPSPANPKVILLLYVAACDHQTLPATAPLVLRDSSQGSVGPDTFHHTIGCTQQVRPFL